MPALQAKGSIIYNYATNFQFLLRIVSAKPPNSKVPFCCFSSMPDLAPQTLTHIMFHITHSERRCWKCHAQPILLQD